MLRERISVLVPTLNEEGNVADLVRRLDVSFRAADIEYEVIFIDDHSTDGTRVEVEKLSHSYPASFHLKKGRRGKAHSILEGFDFVRFETIAMIDADLQYPPEALPEMCAQLHRGLDIVVANRVERETSLARRILSRGFALVFSKFLHGLDVDVQSGMKVFRARIAREVKIAPDPWTFDLEFLLTARNYGYEIGGHSIIFSERKSGESKIVFWKAIREIGWNAVKLRFRGRPPLRIHPEAVPAGKIQGMIGAGIAHKRKRFVTHSTLPHHFSALHTFVSWQKVVLIGIAFAFALGMLFRPMATLIAATAVLTSIYFFDVLFNAFFVVRSLRRPPEISFSDKELAAIRDERLPLYSILCPLYREAHILPGFLEAIGKLDWPKEKLEALLLLEENDEETIRAATEMNLPSFVRVVVVPHSEPKTKPKACNYGLSMTRGEYVVIYDAEDIPDPLQLKKAYLGFQTLSRDVWCLQAKLNYFNANQNILTRLFTAEYSLWFDVTLPGLQSVATSIPLGGTSNHFRREDLLELEGWDPFNVTEDCDLGARIFTRGHRTAIIDSVTLEEANSKVGNWIRQRSRWIKGYMQTYLVHMRQPVRFFRDNGIHALLFQFVVGGKIAFMLINPILWLQTIAYFAFRSIAGPTIEALYPPTVFYMAVVSLVFGNFLAMYYYMIGCAKREKWELMKWVFLIPFYWLLVSVAAVMAAYQLLVKPHYWEKTTHGLHLLKRKKKSVDAVSIKKTDKVLEPSIHMASKSVSRMKSLPVFLGKAFYKSVLFVRKPVDNGASEESVWISRRAHSVWKFILSPEGFFLFALFVANVINFLFNVFLGRQLSLEYFGLVTFVNTLWSFVTIFTSTYGTTVNHHIAYTSSSTNSKWDGAWLLALLRRGSLGMSIVSVVWIFVVPYLSSYFRVDELTLYLFTPVFIFGFSGAAMRGFIQGKLRFYVASAAVLFEPISKFILAAIMVFVGRPDLSYLSVPYSVVLASAFVFIWVFRDVRTVHGSESEPPVHVFPKQFYMAALIGNIGTLLFLNVDLLLVKHYFSSVVSGEYALLSLVGKMVFFMGTLPLSLLITLVSRVEGKGRNPRRTFYKIYLLTGIFVVGSVFVFWMFGDILVPFLFGPRASVIFPYLLMYTSALGFFTLTNVIVTYHLAREHFIFPFLILLSAISVAILVSLNHSTLHEVVESIFLVSFSWWAMIQVLDIFKEFLLYVRNSIRDLLGVFEDLPFESSCQGKRYRILIFNWRDRRHKCSGGAEEYVHEIAKKWVVEGHGVTLFCGNDGECARYEVVDGVRVIRRGGFYFVYVWAFIYYLLRFRNQYDIVIDCQNGVPFFTPIYVRKPVYCLMHHVHRSVFFRDLPRPLAYFANFLESVLMPLIYRNTRFFTVSESSRREMLNIGLGKAGIEVVPPGVHFSELHNVGDEKSDHPVILYLGRLKAYKSIDVLIRAFVLILKDVPSAELIIAGSGEEYESLKKLAADLDISRSVLFTGYVSDSEKYSLLRRAWAVVNPSYMEGWGIVSIEANACRTLVIAADVPGLRDSVQDAYSGYLVEYGNVEKFADKILLVLLDKELRKKLEVNAQIWAENFNWDKSSKVFLESILEKAI